MPAHYEACDDLANHFAREIVVIENVNTMTADRIVQAR
jgi:hypothetical protein